MKTPAVRILSRFAILILITAVLPSCTRDVDVKGSLKRGWTKFENGKYDSAIEKFQQALTIAGENAEAYSGLGWSYARLGLYEIARTEYLNGLAVDDTDPEIILDLQAGLTFLYAVLEQHALSVEMGETVLDEDPDYRFEHDARITAYDVRLQLAHVYFILGSFQECAAHLDILDPAGAPHSADPTALFAALSQLGSGLIF